MKSRRQWIFVCLIGLVVVSLNRAKNSSERAEVKVGSDAVRATKMTERASSQQQRQQGSKSGDRKLQDPDAPKPITEAKRRTMRNTIASMVNTIRAAAVVNSGKLFYGNDPLIEEAGNLKDALHQDLSARLEVVGLTGQDRLSLEAAGIFHESGLAVRWTDNAALGLESEDAVIAYGLGDKSHIVGGNADLNSVALSRAPRAIGLGLNYEFYIILINVSKSPAELVTVVNPMGMTVEEL